MTFRIALSGLNAAQSDLSVTANNISNANTTGFKSSRAEFGDFFPTSTYGLASTAVGEGVRLERVAQKFTQGTINSTGNSLDLAVSGEGFFTLSNNGSLAYTRAGAFSTDRNGYVVDATGNHLQVFPPITGTNTFDTGRLTDLQLSTADSAPSATTKLTANLNLPSNAQPPATATFSAADPTSYNQTTSVTAYDSLGTSHTANLYFIKTATANTWDMRVQIDGNAVGAASTLTYSANGTLISPSPASVVLPPYTPTTGASPISLTVDLAKTTQYGESFGVSSLQQDGYTTGRLTGLEVTSTGVVQARYTNGQANPLGQLALTNFANPQGLQHLGNTEFGETYTSGQALHGAAGTTNFGQIQSGALEASNVDLTDQLVNMITAQRNFQANAQMIQTQDQITQTIIQIR